MRRKQDPVLGVLAGVAMATLTSIVALVVYAYHGPKAFERLSTTIGIVVAVYYAAGIVGGAVVGLLLPLTTWRWGAALVGMVAAAPLYAAITVATGARDVLFVVIGSVFVGGIVGYGAWSPPRDRKPPP